MIAAWVLIPTVLTAKAGTSWTDLVVMTFRQPDENFVMTYRDQWITEVESIDGSGNVFLHRRRKNLETTMDGVKMPGGDDQKISLTLTPRGALKQRQEAVIDPEIEERLARIACIVLPPDSESKTWSYEYPASASGHVPAMKLDFRRGERDTVSIRLAESSGKNPMKGSGTAILGPDGYPLSMSLKIGGAMIPGGDGAPTSLTFTLERQKP